ncbi:YciI family protein [Kluyveromyces lactis]|uniref:KLLA0E02267p n=1 Tax=Kluyveromyces lactis (strain ATCC 8585 / CBS 2359 / DSM 70799 / NBRC 1267 / NRRL Y-1140 / WM37) TaxID=284590 RepID=Q6CPT9_KLULA|nr:uncharacterized protein KLLA0_E02267g [Kluyveromyces lactis]CAG99137.1 KLLA0E02267p [Kluyveromyces lactis]|eukprot:XP_454050.1 uncharacterized protein KLLA0_E02267g [Kluyveromyces lactis]
MVEWVVIVYDKPGSDRSACRPQHLAGIPPLVEAGKIVHAGAIYKDVVDGKPANFAGSHLTIVADSKDEVVELLKNDVFAKNDIWDVDNALIYPFGCAVRKEKQ